MRSVKEWHTNLCVKPSELVSGFPVGEWVMTRKLKNTKIPVAMKGINVDGDFLSVMRTW